MGGGWVLSMERAAFWGAPSGASPHPDPEDAAAVPPGPLWVFHPATSPSDPGIHCCQTTCSFIYLPNQKRSLLPRGCLPFSKLKGLRLQPTLKTTFQYPLQVMLFQLAESVRIWTVHFGTVVRCAPPAPPLCSAAAASGRAGSSQE